MRHTIRQHGQLTQIDCELGSAIYDITGTEICEHDIVEDEYGRKHVVHFFDGSFRAGTTPLVSGWELRIVGHTGD